MAIKVDSSYPCALVALPASAITADTDRYIVYPGRFGFDFAYELTSSITQGKTDIVVGRQLPPRELGNPPNAELAEISLHASPDPSNPTFVNVELSDGTNYVRRVDGLSSQAGFIDISESSGQSINAEFINILIDTEIPGLQVTIGSIRSVYFITSPGRTDSDGTVQPAIPSSYGTNVGTETLLESGNIIITERLLSSALPAFTENITIGDTTSPIVISAESATEAFEGEVTKMSFSQWADGVVLRVDSRNWRILDARQLRHGKGKWTVQAIRDV